MKARVRWAPDYLAAIVLALLLACTVGAAAQYRLRVARLAPARAQDVTDAGAGAAATAADALRPEDRTFIAAGVENSRIEAEVLRLAMSQATKTEVRSFAQQAADDYREIQGALEGLARRKAVDVGLQPTSYSDSYKRLAQQTGAAFDREFIRFMAETNNATLRLLERATSASKDADVRQIAGNLLPLVRDHVNKTKDLQKAFD
jgi:predicted outer membrane protein